MLPRRGAQSQKLATASSSMSASAKNSKKLRFGKPFSRSSLVFNATLEHTTVKVLSLSLLRSPGMVWTIINLHRVLLCIVVLITVLTIALSVSYLVQQLDGNIRSAQFDVPYLPIAGLAVFLGFLSIPRLNDLVVKPNMVSHIPTQVSVCLCGAVFITLTGIMAFQSPIVTWLSANHINPYLMLAPGFFCLALGIVGSLRAIWPIPYEKSAGSMVTLRKVHFCARALAAICGFVTSGVVLGSVFVFGSPTTPQTVSYSIFLYCIAAILGSSRLSVAGFENPISLWNIALQFLLAIIAIFIIKLATRAFVFHTHLYGSFAEIVPIYPRFENLLMLPFVVFALTSSALALTRQTRTDVGRDEDFAII